jgi:tRNA-splicing ligase RtcB
MELKQHLIKLNDYLWEIPQRAREGMLVPAHIYASERLVQDIGVDKSLEQLTNVAMLPGICKAAIVMPDVHEGYGFPIGGVAATEWPTGVISPGGIGYDINCGVRLVRSHLEHKDLLNNGEDLAKSMYAHIPSGAGKSGPLQLTPDELSDILKNGVRWALKQHYAEPEDIHLIESEGCLTSADPSCVSDHARKRGYDQLGTIGSGNHFVEVSYIDTIFDPVVASTFGLKLNQVVILIHTGSRGLGHQVATDYLRRMVATMESYKIHLPDRELACAPFNSVDGQEYFKAMAAAANFAWCNRQIITWELRKLWEQFFDADGKLELVYDVAHNIAKIEDHLVNGETKKLIVHRKGSTRAFGPGHPEIPLAYRTTGQPVIIPGSMGTASYVMVGTVEGMEKTFGSSCHGAGRRLSRRAAQRTVNVAVLEEELMGMDIHIRAGSRRSVGEEAPIAYKDIEEVINVVHMANLAHKVARMKPIAVVKG